MPNRFRALGSAAAISAAHSSGESRERHVGQLVGTAMARQRANDDVEPVEQSQRVDGGQQQRGPQARHKHRDRPVRTRHRRNAANGQADGAPGQQVAGGRDVRPLRMDHAVGQLIQAAHRTRAVTRRQPDIELLQRGLDGGPDACEIAHRYAAGDASLRPRRTAGPPSSSSVTRLMKRQRACRASGAGRACWPSRRWRAQARHNPPASRHGRALTRPSAQGQSCTFCRVVRYGSG